MLQYFEWYLPADGSHWDRLRQDARHLRETGFTQVWMPPAYKGQAGQNDVGYGVYDLYDLGEFGAKGSIETKYGSIGEYQAAIEELNRNGLRPIADIVFNHRMGSDQTEEVCAHPMDWNDRNRQEGEDRQVEVWTKYTFPERNGKYSGFQWGWQDFTGTDYDARSGSTDLIQFCGKEWNQDVSHEQGNFDYIMGSDLDFHSERVKEELVHWGRWYRDMTGIRDYRLDAVKSIDATFFPVWLKDVEGHSAVGEYWSGNVQELEGYLEACGYAMRLFDVPLHFRLCQISKGEANLQDVFADSLTRRQPDYSVPFADNHDTQPGQALYSWVEGWFKPHAYALLLLRDAQLPCVFYGDLYGIPHDDIGPVAGLARLVWIRKNLLGTQLYDFQSEDGDMMAWSVQGDHPVVCVLSVKDAKQVHMEVPAGTYVDVFTGKPVDAGSGWGDFCVEAGRAGVFIRENDWQALLETNVK